MFPLSLPQTCRHSSVSYTHLDVYKRQLISRSAADKVKEYVDIALNHGHGCELVLDGRNPELPEKNKNGYFVGPTIIKDVTPCNPLFTTEVFGPLVATIKIADIDDALELLSLIHI